MGYTHCTAGKQKLPVLWLHKLWGIYDVHAGVVYDALHSGVERREGAAMACVLDVS